MHDLIFVSLEDWDEVWRRNQFLCAGLARRYPERQILFVGLPRDFTHAIRTADWPTLRRPATWKVPGLSNITVTHPLKLFPNSLNMGRRFNDLIFRFQVKSVVKKLHLEHPLLWLNPHSAFHMIGKMGERAIIYDITDDWIAFNRSSWLAELTREQDRALCQAADAVIVCSEWLVELKKPLARSVNLIPNGVDAEHYQAMTDPAQPVPEETRSWRHPVFGYVGTIHPERVDLCLVETLARKLPEATVVLIGPLLLSEGDRRRLEAAGNVLLLGPKPYDDIPKYMRALDVCITPHLVTPFTESLNPIKLWEYLATGKPIVSTEVAGFRDYPQWVHLAKDHEQFVARCQEALHEPAGWAAQRIAEARRHSWESRINQVEAVFAGVVR